MSGWCTSPSATPDDRHQNFLTPCPRFVRASEFGIRQLVSKCSLTRCIGIPNKTAAHINTKSALLVGSKRYLGTHSFLPLIKSKTEQRNHHWHLVNVKLHYLLFTTQTQPWLESNKKKKKSPSQSESMLHRNVSELHLMWEP